MRRSIQLKEHLEEYIRCPIIPVCLGFDPIPNCAAVYISNLAREEHSTNELIQFYLSIIEERRMIFLLNDTQQKNKRVKNSLLCYCQITELIDKINLIRFDLNLTSVALI